VLTFGGQDPNQQPSAQALEFQNGSWHVPNGSSDPPARWGAALAYDPVDDELVLFGGCTTAQCSPAYGDTWTFHDGAWTDITSSAVPAPPARGNAFFGWDSTDECAVLFGGYDGSVATSFNDTWTFVHGQWTNKTGNLTGPSPPARFDGAASSELGGGLLIFGGHGTAGLLSDTWSYSGGAWTDLTGSAGSGPSARVAATLVEDPADGYLLLFGGYNDGTYYGDTWEFLGGHWDYEGTSSGPPATYGAGTAYDSSSGVVVLYGGTIPAGVTDAVWTYSHGSWTLLNPTSSLLSAIGFVFLVLLFPILIIVPTLIGTFLRRRRERALSSLFPPPAPGQVQWVPAGRVWTMYGDVIATGVVFVVIFGFLAAFLLSALPPGASILDLLAVSAPVLLVLLILPVAMVLGRAQAANRSIGICPSGVIVQRRRAELRVPWAYIEPARFPPRRGRFFFTYTFPGTTVMRGSFLTTVEQAKAIIGYPNAPAWVLPPNVALALGRSPAYPTVGGGWAAPGSAPPAPGGLPPYAPPPPPPAPSGLYANPLFPPPPPPPLPTSAPGSSITSSGSAQIRKCGRCGTLSTVRARFCPNCGQPFTR
jgi:hypothetical protein